MFWNIVFAVASFALQLLLIPKPQNAKPASLDDFEAPTAEEGIEISVLFGTKPLKAPNVVWYGDLKVNAIKGARRYGFFGPRATVGHKYSLGVHMGLCHGPADKITKIEVGDKVAWEGITTGGLVSISEDDLFGGDEKEGGIDGRLSVDMGEPDQVPNDYLVSVLGEDVPAFRGIVSVILRQMYLGTSPYIKPWSFLTQRIYLRSDGTEQWYPEKAGIGGATLEATINADISGAPQIVTDYTMDLNQGFYVNLGDAGNTLSCWSSDDFTNPLWSVATVRDEQAITMDDLGNIYAGAQLGTSVNVYDRETGAFKTEITGMNNGGNQAVSSITVEGITHVFSIGSSLGYARGSGSSFITIGFVDTPNWLSTSNSFCVSPERVYVAANGFLSGNKKSVYIHTYSAAVLDEATFVDLTTDLAGDRISSISWLEDIEKVLIIDDNGGIYIYDETLTSIENSKDDGLWVMSHASQLMSRRIKSGTGTITFRGSGPGGRNLVLTYGVPDLTLLYSYDASDEGFVGGLNSAYGFCGYDYEENYIVVTGSSGIAPPVAWSGPRFSAVDMNPAHIIRECLTDKLWGMGYNDGDIDDDAFTSAADALYIERFGLSLLWAREEKIEEFITMVISHIDAYLYTSRRTGKFVLKLIRDDYDIDLIPVIDEDDVVTWNEVSRRQPAEAVNSVIVKYYDRENEKDASHQVNNIAQIQQLGEIVSTTRNYPGINIGELAIRVAMRDVRSLGIGFVSGRLNGKRTLEDLNPGDPFRLVSAKHELTGEVMRAVDLKFGDGRSNQISLKFVQDVFSLDDEAIVDHSNPDWENPANPPIAVAISLVQEMTYFQLINYAGLAQAAEMTNLDPDVAVIEVAAASPTNGSINALLAVDSGSGYVTGEALEFCPVAVLNADFGNTATDVTIDLREDQDLDEVEIGDLAAIGDEIVSVVAVAGNTFTFKRALLDTVLQEHSEGDAVIFFGTSSLSDMEQYNVADTVSVKLRTTTGSGVLSLAAAPEDTITFDSRAIRPLRPADVKVEGDGYGPVDAEGLLEVVVTWANRNRLTETTPLAWTGATVTPEVGQTTTIEVLDVLGNVITTHSGITGTTYNVPVGSFGGNSIGVVRVLSERAGYRSYRYHEITVFLDKGYGLAYGYNYGGAV